MAEKDCLSSDGAGEHAAGDTVCLSRGYPRSAWRCSIGRGDRDHLLGDGGSLGSDGRSGAIAAAACGVVAGHYFLFSGVIFFLQNADIRKSPDAQRLPPCLRADDFKCYLTFVQIDFLLYFPFFFFACTSSTTT